MTVKPFLSSQESLPGRGRCSHWGVCGDRAQHTHSHCVDEGGFLGLWAPGHLTCLFCQTLALLTVCIHCENTRELALLLWGLSSHRQGSTPKPFSVPCQGSPHLSPSSFGASCWPSLAENRDLHGLPFPFLWAEPSLRCRGRNLA